MSWFVLWLVHVADEQSIHASEVQNTTGLIA